MCPNSESSSPSFEKSAYEKIGGRNKLHTIVNLFYDKILADEEVSHFFNGVDMDQQRGKMKAFLMMALGGPAFFTGRGLRESHSKLVGLGLNEYHYAVIRNYLVESMAVNGVSSEIIKAVSDLTEAVKNDVLNR